MNNDDLSMVKQEIDKLRQKLNDLMDSNEQDREIISGMSCELDLLILSFYRLKGSRR